MASPSARSGGTWAASLRRDITCTRARARRSMRSRSKERTAPHDFLAMRKGFVVADAAGIFDEMLSRVPDLIEIRCNMHARRYFVKALEANDARAAIPIKAFKTLYDVEDDVRGADSDRRFEERMRRSKPVYEESSPGAKTVSTRGATELLCSAARWATS